jgi:hypothetical protein
MTTTSTGRAHGSGDENGDRPSLTRVEEFLEGIERKRSAARKARWVGLVVGVVIGGVALLTAIGVVPAAAENVVLSASAVVAGLGLSKGESAAGNPGNRTDQH